MTLTNRKGWGIEHFSADEIGIAEMELAFFFIQVPKGRQKGSETNIGKKREKKKKIRWQLGFRV